MLGNESALSCRKYEHVSDLGVVDRSAPSLLHASGDLFCDITICDVSQK